MRGGDTLLGGSGTTRTPAAPPIPAHRSTGSPAPTARLATPQRRRPHHHILRDRPRERLLEVHEVVHRQLQRRLSRLCERAAEVPIRERPEQPPLVVQDEQTPGPLARPLRANIRMADNRRQRKASAEEGALGLEGAGRRMKNESGRQRFLPFLLCAHRELDERGQAVLRRRAAGEIRRLHHVPHLQQQALPDAPCGLEAFQIIRVKAQSSCAVLILEACLLDVR